MALICLLIGIIFMKAKLNADPCSFQPHDCQDIWDFGIQRSGVYKVVPTGSYSALEVYCDFDTDGGGWLVFQRRVDDSWDFRNNWREYQSGFGDIEGNYWLGNENLRMVVKQGYYQLRIELGDWNGSRSFATYDIFDIGSTKENYELTVEGYTGDAGDSFGLMNGAHFATVDRDITNKSCADKYKVGWWYLLETDCFHVNLNGLYVNGGGPLLGHALGMIWSHWRGFNYSLKSTEMKIRRK